MASALTSRDLRTLLDIVRAVSAADTLPEFRRMVPELALRAVPGNLAGYNEIDIRTGATYVTFSPTDAVAPAVVERFADYALDHPTLQRHARGGDGSAVAISDVVTRGAYRESRLYRELFAGIGAEDQLTIGLPAPRPLIIGVPVNRDRWGFGQRERDLFDELRPHLAQAHANAAIRDWLRDGVQARDAALRHTGTAVIRVDRETVADASPEALRWLRPGLLDGDRLAGNLREWYLEQRSRLGGSPDAPPDVASPLRLTDEGGAAAVRFVDEGTLLIEQVAESAAPETELTKFGLTTSQARVMHLLVSGASTRQISQRLHITEGTVRAHLRAIFPKLGVHTRAAAVAVVLTPRPPDTGP